MSFCSSDDSKLLMNHDIWLAISDESLDWECHRHSLLNDFFLQLQKNLKGF
jgi:predicted GH43/DUF377 family glycosyl hydrolase